MICFYHSADLDGHCSGAIVKLAHPDCELYGIDYGDEFPWDKVKGQEVVMVDFSLQPFKDMLRLEQEAKRLVWMDHHKSAIEDEVSYNSAIEGFRDVDKAGCELTWEYFFPGAPLPETVRLLGRYDVWDHSDPDTLPFQYGMRQHETIPEGHILTWKYWIEEFPKDILEEGKGRLLKIKADNKRTMEECSFETELDGLKCVAINRLCNSQAFESVWDPKKHDAMLTFVFKRTFWTISMYSTKEDVDVSVICKARGGGGHKGAAGFQCTELPFRLPVAVLPAGKS